MGCKVKRCTRHEYDYGFCLKHLKKDIEKQNKKKETTEEE